MDAPEHRRRISISLDADSYAFVERFLAAGVVESPDELFRVALDALCREMEACARKVAIEEGCPNAESASLDELADVLDRSGRWRDN